MFRKRFTKHAGQITQGLVVCLCLIGFIAWALATTTTAASRPKSRARVAMSSVVAPAALPANCTLPGVQVVSDPQNDQNGSQVGGPTQQLDILGVYFAEPGTDTNAITITLKVQNLSGTLMPNATWQVNMNVRDTGGTLRTIFVNMNTTDNPPNAAFNFGYNTSVGGSGNDTSQGTPGVVSGSFTPDGTITIKLNTANVISFNDISAAHQFDVDLRQPGVSISGINAATSALVGVLGNGVSTTVDTANSGTATYLTVGNAACSSSSTPTPTPTATATPTPTPTPTATPTATPVPGAGVPRFFTYNSPTGIADDSGEPSIGSNWTREATNHNHNVNGSINDIPNGGTTLYFGGFSPGMTKVTWDECSSPAGATWESKPLLSANTPRAFGDPILLTDSTTGRTFCGQLEGLTPAGCTIDITDNDGDTFIPSDGVIPSDVDHETIGVGPYHSPLPNPNPLFPHAVYYASQSIYDARSLRSDNGGLDFSQATTPMYTNAQCGGLHGHLKVAPDGTVYLPNKACGGDPTAFQGTPPANYHLDGHQSVVFSEDNGISWTVSEVPDAVVAGEWDPSVGIASDGTIYFGYQGKDGHARIAVGHHTPGTTGSPGTITWSPSVDVGAAAGINNIVFPAVVAGDPDRAAFAFIGTTQGDGPGEDHTGGANNDPGAFTGAWYLYVATTFDGGHTWYTQNVTPGDPVQRGPICGGSDCRNLLDFMDATIDKEGRVLVGSEDGCISAGCIAGDKNKDGKIDGFDNDFAAKGIISRQIGGKRMFAAFDPVEPAVPGAPGATGTADQAGTTATLTWLPPDNGGSPIVAYNIYRKVGSGAFALLASVPTTTYVDPTFAAGDVYHVTAVNAIGEGPYCPDVSPILVAAPATACTIPGILAVNDINPDGTDNDSGQNTPPDPRVNIRQLFIAEPFIGAGPANDALVFTMRLAPSTMGSAPASSQWYIVWNRQGTDPTDPNDASFDRLWVGMKTDLQGNISFQYGKFGVPLDTSVPPNGENPNANTPVSFGNADSGSYDVASGVVTITVSNSKLRAIDGGAQKYTAGTALSALNVRTYLARPDAGQKSQNNANDITTDNEYALRGNSVCATGVPILGAVSRKTHGANGTFDVGLPLTGAPGIECRTGGPNGDYTVVFVFANPIASVAGASTSAGSVASRGPGADPHEYVVNVTGVRNAQVINITLTGITDTVGNTSPSVTAPMGVLVGDTNSDRSVNSADIGQVKSQSGHTLDGTNFREDLNCDGDINSADISFVKSTSGTGY